ncbi:MAG: SAM-dependent methyltransferase, partial [Betaproteobacteria bacterium]|nr:SAM-dependent methyltransferase [Betaproteobacteria bacterium]
LVLVYLVLSTPFFCAANAIGLALTAFRERAGRVYAADLCGAGLGAALVLALLYRLWPEDALRMAAATGFLATFVGALELRAQPKTWAGVALVGLAALALLPDPWLRFEPGPYKGLSQALQVAGTRVVLERSGPLGRITVTSNSEVPLRHAPGLGLTALGEPPPQLALFVDGDGLQAITAASDDPARLAFLRESTAALPYRLGSPRSVLVAGAGGGMEVLRARAFGATRIDALELDRQVARLLAEDFRGFTGALIAQPGIHAYLGEARGFLTGSDRRYDLIQLPAAAMTGGGLGGLNEDYGYTVEALRLDLAHLVEGGYLAATVAVQVPPRDALKLV